MYECLLSLAYEKDCKMSENTSHHGFDRNKEQLPNLFANVFVEKKTTFKTQIAASMIAFCQTVLAVPDNGQLVGLL